MNVCFSCLSAFSVIRWECTRQVSCLFLLLLCSYLFLFKMYLHFFCYILFHGLSVKCYNKQIAYFFNCIKKWHVIAQKEVVILMLVLLVMLHTCIVLPVNLYNLLCVPKSVYTVQTYSLLYYWLFFSNHIIQTWITWITWITLNVKYSNLNNKLTLLFFRIHVIMTIITSSHQNSKVKLGKDYFYTVLLRCLPTTGGTKLSHNMFTICSFCQESVSFCS